MFAPTQLEAISDRSTSDWSPYEFHSGTIVGVAGDDYVLVASDTRLTDDRDVLLSRQFPHIQTFAKNLCLLTTGFMGDTTALVKILQMELMDYQLMHRRVMPVEAMASLLSSTLYRRRFFPLYTYNLVAGIDRDGHGALFGFDPVGSYERLPFACGGPGSSLITPLLDSQIGMKNRIPEGVVSIGQEEVLKTVVDMFTSAAERQVNVGDGLLVSVLSADGKTKTGVYPLRKD
ncbi:hypothetical protein ACOME3_002477 [Neoechinorhynchus agilis]